MEETIWVFKNFLSQIADAEERLDEYRTKIQAISGAKMEIFSLINVDKK